MLRQIRSLLPRSLRLIAVGLIATLAYSVFSLSFVWFGGLSAPISSLFGHMLAGFVSYFGHRIFTFELTGGHRGAPGRFIVLNISSYLVACISPWIATQVFNLLDTAAILITAMVLPAINAVLIAKFVFKEPLVLQPRPKEGLSRGT